MDQENVDEIHLVKINVISKPTSPLKLQCPYLKNFNPKVQLRNKWPLYLPLIQRVYISKEQYPPAKPQLIPIDVKTLLEYPFDKHTLKIQTYVDQNKQQKGEVICAEIQFALALTLKEKVNYLDVYFRFAHLKKDVKIFGKMSPRIIVKNDEWKYQSQPVKDGHLSPNFDEVINIPFNSVFDRVFIEVKHQDELIGSEQMYIFEFFGKQESRQAELKRQSKMVGTVTYCAQDFNPEDF